MCICYSSYFEPVVRGCCGIWSDQLRELHCLTLISTGGLRVVRLHLGALQRWCCKIEHTRQVWCDACHRCSKGRLQMVPKTLEIFCHLILLMSTTTSWFLVSLTCSCSTADFSSNKCARPCGAAEVMVLAPVSFTISECTLQGSALPPRNKVRWSLLLSAKQSAPTLGLIFCLVCHLRNLHVEVKLDE